MRRGEGEGLVFFLVFGLYVFEGFEGEIGIGGYGGIFWWREGFNGEASGGYLLPLRPVWMQS